MRYSDHLETVRKLEKQIADLRARPVDGDAVIDYLITSSEGLITAARILIEAKRGGG